jgi:hypothetical protein
MNEEALKTDPNAVPLQQLTDDLAAEFLSRFASIDSEISDESREFMLLLYRNGFADGLRIAITMLNEAQNYNPKYNDFPEMSKLVVAGMWELAADPLTVLAEALVDKVRASYEANENEQSE